MAQGCTVFAHEGVHVRTVVVRTGWMMAIWILGKGINAP
jgi:hypothetical protein